jgi:leader peptidase (prepilin peptidase)/N-methyltransferase
MFAVAGQPAWAAIAVVAGAATGIVPVDLRERRIPTPLVAAAAIAAVVSVAITSIENSSWSVTARALGGAALVGGAFLIVHLLHPAGLGFGDVRLATLAGGLVAYGTGNLTVAVATATVAAVAAALVTIAARSRSAPFAPFLIGAALVALAIAVG